MLPKQILSMCVCLAVAFSFMLVTGCGPTAEGKKNRSLAQQRVGAFHATLAHDQAKQAFEVGNLDRAKNSIQGAIMRYPEVPAYHTLLGRIYLEQHKLEEARLSFEKAIELDPNQAEPHYFLGIVFERWSDDQTSYEHYSKAFELDETRAQFLMATTESLISLGELDAAVQLVEEHMDHFEHNAGMQQVLGEIAMLRGDPSRAVDHYATARMLNPDNLLLLEQLAVAQFEAGQYGKACESVHSLRDQLKDERPDLMRLEARALMMLDRSSEARDLYVQLTQINPTDDELWVEFGMLVWSMGDYRRVAQCAARVTAIAPDRPEGYMLKGVFKREQGDMNEALRFLDEAARRSEHQALPHLLLGQALEANDQAKLAMFAYRNALQAEPDSVEAKMLIQRLEQADRITSAPTDQGSVTR